MKRLPIALLALLLALLVAACQRGSATVSTPSADATPTAGAASGEPTATGEGIATAPAEGAGEPLYVSIIWHQHQPLYFKEPETGVYQKPWVRLHAAKDYVDMAAILQNYPDIHATFNLTPSLLRQIEDLSAGSRDLYWVHTELPAAALTDEQREFVASRFFDINPKIIARFPRFQALADDRANSADWGEAEYRDLQLLFNLGWTDPDWLATGPLAALVEKGEGYTEEDKVIVLEEHQRLINEVIPLHAEMQQAGQIEITTTPYFHPILPLLVDSNLAAAAVPDIALPPRFQYPVDAVAQLQLGVDYYTETFGQPPRGMWPAEGSVAEEIVGMVGRAGIQWMASDEEVLARSLGQTGFSRDSSETVTDADALYRPYTVRRRPEDPPVTIVFRDKVISDKVGFTYSGMEGEAAAEDFVGRLTAIRAQLDGSEGPHLVSVILDGENAWEHYPNDGKAFLNRMYELLEAEQAAGTLRTVTPSEFIAEHAEAPEIETLWAGSWVSPDYLTWIGEEEENRAWEYLAQVRAYVEQKKTRLDEETLAQVMDAIYTAEGSDWFWWYGSDQNSGDDGAFDEQFRRTLQRVYELAGDEPPVFLSVPVIPQQTQAGDISPSGVMTATIDGAVGEGEWEAAGRYTEEGGVQATAEQVVSELYYGFDGATLYLRLDARRPWRDIAAETRVGFYLTRPGAAEATPFSRYSDETLLGFNASGLAEITIAGDTVSAALLAPDGEGGFTEDGPLEVALSGTTIELAIPFERFGKPDAGDSLRLRAVVSEGQARDIQLVPRGGPGEMAVPDLGLTTPILTVADAAGDDHGPGTYTYPSDGVFGAGAYDITEFQVAEDESNVIFRFTFAGPLNNDWGAPNGMGIHTLDVYIDGAEDGARTLFPGRNAAVPADQAWDVGLWAEGWEPGVYGPPAEGESAPAELAGGEAMTILSDPAQSRITIRVSKADLAAWLGTDALDLASYRYLGIVMGQEGFPSTGVWRIRDIAPSAQQWRFGGAPTEGTNHTRIIDVAYPEGFTPTQEESLGAATPSDIDPDEATPDDYAPLPMVPVGE